MINSIINWVDKNINIDDTISMKIDSIKHSRRYTKKNIPNEAINTPLIVYYNNRLLDGHNRYNLHLKLGNEYVDVIMLPELGDKILYIDLIISEINRKFFEKRVRNSFL